jgi:hypothetical protein
MGEADYSVYCNECGELLSESAGQPSATRTPCPKCGSLSRRHCVSITEGITASDHVAAIQSRDGEAIGFTESERQGRASSAATAEDGSVSFTLTGTSPTGEEDTLQACRILLAALKRHGEEWVGLRRGDGLADCIAQRPDGSEGALEIQVVRAIPDQTLWKGLAQSRRLEQASVQRDDLVRQLRAAVGLKSGDEKIPPPSRGSLVLALDANRLPAVALPAVVRDYRAAHGPWTRSLGFQAVWVVGPDASLTWRLDTE